MPTPEERIATQIGNLVLRCAALESALEAAQATIKKHEEAAVAAMTGADKDKETVTPLKRRGGDATG